MSLVDVLKLKYEQNKRIFFQQCGGSGKNCVKVNHQEYNFPNLSVTVDTSFVEREPQVSLHLKINDTHAPLLNNRRLTTQKNSPRKGWCATAASPFRRLSVNSRKANTVLCATIPPTM